MGRLGNYIDQMCREHPAAMQAVLGRSFCPFNKWEDNSGNACLVGTIRRARGKSTVAGRNMGLIMFDDPRSKDQIAEAIRDQTIGMRASMIAVWVGARALGLRAHCRVAPVVNSRDNDMKVDVEFDSVPPPTATLSAFGEMLAARGTARVTPAIKARIQRRLAEQAPPVVVPEHVLIGSVFREIKPTRREVAYALGFEEPLVWHPDEVDTASPAELTLSG